MMTINDDYFNNAPAWVLYKTNYDLFIKSFHLTPLLIKNALIKNSNFDVKKGIDDFISSNFLTKKIKVFQNSKKICWASYEFENEKEFIQFKYSKNLLISINWVKNCTSEYQRYLFKKYTFRLSTNYNNKNYFIRFKIFFNILVSLINYKNLLNLINRFKNKIF